MIALATYRSSAKVPHDPMKMMIIIRSGEQGANIQVPAHHHTFHGCCCGMAVHWIPTASCDQSISDLHSSPAPHCGDFLNNLCIPASGLAAAAVPPFYVHHNNKQQRNGKCIRAILRNSLSLIVVSRRYKSRYKTKEG